MFVIMNFFKSFNIFYGRLGNILVVLSRSFDCLSATYVVQFGVCSVISSSACTQRKRKVHATEIEGLHYSLRIQIWFN